MWFNCLAMWLEFGQCAYSRVEIKKKNYDSILSTNLKSDFKEKIIGRSWREITGVIFRKNMMFLVMGKEIIQASILDGFEKTKP